MSKVYDLTATLNTGRLRNSDWLSDSWTNFFYNPDDPVGYSGYDEPRYYATNMLFDQSTLEALRSKVSNGVSVTDLTLEVNCVQAMTGETYIAYKYNSMASGVSSSLAWARSTNEDNAPINETADSLAYIIPAQSLSIGTQTFNLKRTTPFSGIPKYGLIAGPRRLVSGRWRFTSAVLHVVTNETDYTLSFDANGGSGAPASDTKTGTTSYTFTIPSTVPSCTGYDFLGWSTSSSATSASYQPGGTITISSNTTLYAVWKKKTYSIGYNANGGTGAPGSQTKTYGEDLTLSSTIPTKGDAYAGNFAVTFDANGGSVTPASASAPRTTSFSFKNWNTAANGSGTSYASGGIYTANETATLYAQWNSYTKTAAVALPAPSLTGYTFNGWYTQSSGGTRVGGAGDRYKPTENITLYAQWAKNTYPVGYNANGGTGAPAGQTKTYGENLTLRSETPTRSGYSFSNWNTKADGTGTSYAPGGTYTANESVTLYAIWTSNSRTLSYNANGGTGAPAAQTFFSGSSVTLSSSTPTRTGHVFLGWSQSDTATTASYAAGGTYTFNSNVTLYAVWTRQTYTISYNANGGSSAPEAQTKTYGEDLTLASSQPTRSGYTFLGWAKSNTATSAAYAPGATYSENGNATLYAVWNAIVSTHTLTYNANGGSGAPAAQTQTYSVEDQRNFTVSSAQPVRDGYAFLGWSNTSSGSVNYHAGDTITAAADKTIYAVWEKTQFTVSYNANGGSNAPEAQTKQKNVALTITESTPSRQDYVFMGWSTDSQATEATYHGGDMFTIDADTVLYAVWGVSAGVHVYVIQNGEPVDCDVYAVVSGAPVLCDVYVGGE